MREARPGRVNDKTNEKQSYLRKAWRPLWKVGEKKIIARAFS
jgi:hypothetical protein